LNYGHDDGRGNNSPSIILASSASKDRYPNVGDVIWWNEEIPMSSFLLGDLGKLFSWMATRFSTKIIIVPVPIPEQGKDSGDGSGGVLLNRQCQVLPVNFVTILALKSTGLN
jgi:hypothetical protein